MNFTKIRSSCETLSIVNDERLRKTKFKKYEMYSMKYVIDDLFITDPFEVLTSATLFYLIKMFMPENTSSMKIYAMHLKFSLTEIHFLSYFLENVFRYLNETQFPNGEKKEKKTRSIDFKFVCSQEGTSFV